MTGRAGRVGSTLLAVALMTSACGATRSGPPVAVPATAGTAALIRTAKLVPCPASAGKASTGKASTGKSSSGSAPAAGAALPDVTLPCLGGGGSVRLARLGRPAVVNLWASWCRECTREMPVLAGVADVAGGRVVFVGVDTEDAPDPALRVLVASGIHYASVYDRGGQLVKKLGLPGLPATILVRADGTVAYRKLGALSGAAELRSALISSLGIDPGPSQGPRS